MSMCLLEIKHLLQKILPTLKASGPIGNPLHIRGKRMLTLDFVFVRSHLASAGKYAIQQPPSGVFSHRILAVSMYNTECFRTNQIVCFLSFLFRISYPKERLYVVLDMQGNDTFIFQDVRLKCHSLCYKGMCRPIYRVLWLFWNATTAWQWYN